MRNLRVSLTATIAAMAIAAAFAPTKARAQENASKYSNATIVVATTG